MKRRWLLILPLILGSSGPPALAAPRLEQLTLGGGCFWCLDAVFRKVRGVVRSECGYAGGTLPHPSYEAVCAGGTGHVEVVQVSFDPAQLRRQDLLAVFLAIHDPSQRDRQGGDVGVQYRSAVFYQQPEQQPAIREALESWARAHPRQGRPVTEVRPLSRFWPAEAYHQDYFNQHPDQPYCVLVVAPKLRKFLSELQPLAR